ncbi:hypothetical protein HR060_18175 [Catenovulum sp. SM1970]|uniref:hypothetical protein n=1 Tax=Marinifaba aquimaris TaxID=2741323 RepID=UPI001572166C|nr:hypothetical protein [Marinifaba aquimaris]NTS78771.1 hypothetical protein [Marinifaba aquimaris]
MKLLKQYDALIASDITNARDGMGVEVYLEDKLLLEIFKDVSLNQSSMTLFDKHVPLELIEASIEYFKQALSEPVDH